MSVDDVATITAASFRAVGRNGVGLEMEWLVFDRTDATAPVAVERVRSAIGDTPLPSGGSVSFEPGGQLEISTVRFENAQAALTALDDDHAEASGRLAQHGLRLVALGIDPERGPVRSLRLPRYDAMELAFDHRGPHGRFMMCSTASLQINVDFGPDPFLSWRAVSAIAPVVAAIFANSPVHQGTTARFASTRSEVWRHIDPTRTTAVPMESSDVAELWARYALDANVLLVRTPDGAEPVVGDFTLRSWIDTGHRLGFPDTEDLRYHLTTLFPPVRPRGWMEVRMIDAIPANARSVAVALIDAVAREPGRFTDVVAVCSNLVAARNGDQWRVAAHGLHDDDVYTAAVELLRCAPPVINLTSPQLADEATTWFESMVRRRRTPADSPLSDRS